MKDLNNNITDAHCSFDVSAELWKKGCRVKTERNFAYLSNHPNGTGWYEDLNSSHSIPRPTLAVAVEWLRVNFNIHIQPEKRFHKKGYYVGKIHASDVSYSTPFPKPFDTPQLATDAALLFALKNYVKNEKGNDN